MVIHAPPPKLPADAPILAVPWTKGEAFLALFSPQRIPRRADRVKPAESARQPALEVTIPVSLRPKAAKAPEKAQAMLKGQGRAR
jgi:hypothetical protein